MGKISSFVWPASVAAAFLLGRYVLPDQDLSHVVQIELLESALSSPDWIARGHTVSAYMEAMGPQELPAALAIVEERRRWMTQDELRLFMIAWARFDAPGAFAHALTWPDYTRNKGAAAALYAWALEDPHAAQRAIQNANDAALQELLVTRLITAWSHGPDKAGATEYIAGIANEGKRDRFTGILAREILSEGAEALIAWGNGVPASHAGYGKTAFGKAAGVLAQHDPARAARWVEENLGQPWARDAPRIVARRWAERDPRAALVWVQGLPAGAPRDRAAARAYSSWLAQSPVEAETWLAAAPSDNALDAARTLQIRRTAATSPALAVDMLESISDTRLREESVVEIAWSWRLSDPIAAAAWLDTLELSDRARAAIETGKRPTRRRRRGASRDVGEPALEVEEPADNLDALDASNYEAP